MIKFIDSHRVEVWVNPIKVTICYKNKNNNFQIEFEGNEYVEFPKSNPCNVVSFNQLTTGNRLINEQELELIKKHNEEASK